MRATKVGRGAWTACTGRALHWLAGLGLATGALGAMGLTLGCPAANGFACSADDDCALNGTPGLCIETNHCAYPDSACPSGLRYPAGAGTLGGMCVPGELTPPTTGLSASGGQTTDAPPPATGTSPSVAVSSAPGSTAGSEVASDSDVVATTSATGPSTSSSGVCDVDDFPDVRNDEIPIVSKECFAEVFGSLDFPDDVDVDFIGFQSFCTGGSFLLNAQESDPALVYCAAPRCEGAIECGGGYWDDEMQMCCGDGGPGSYIQISPADGSQGFCPDGDVEIWDFAATGAGCSEYVLTVEIG